jgi:branched-chain amino acid transport system permease protein
MLGTYAVLVPAKMGVNIWISIFVIAPIFVGLVGILVERVIIRHLYGRMMDTLLATWGLSLLIIGVMTTIFGNTMEGVSTPFGNFAIGEIAESQYKFFIIGITAALMAAVYVGLKYTKLGLIARGTMQNASMASALGISPSAVYTATFGIGAALTGFAGAVLAPVIGAAPTLGVAYVAKAFITVIGGGQAILTGTATASGVFGVINQIVTFFSSSVLGEVALLIGAVVLLRALPQGITGRFFRRGL